MYMYKLYNALHRILHKYAAQCKTVYTRILCIYIVYLYSIFACICMSCFTWSCECDEKTSFLHHLFKIQINNN